MSPNKKSDLRKAPGPHLALVLAISVDCNCIHRSVKPTVKGCILFAATTSRMRSISMTTPSGWRSLSNMESTLICMGESTTSTTTVAMQNYCVIDFLPQNRLILWCTTANISDILFFPPPISHVSAFSLAGLLLPTRLCLGMKKRLPSNVTPKRLTTRTR